MKHTTYDLIVVGAGAMGLAAAYEAACSGLKVAVVEAGNIPGGMAAHFDFSGLSLERFYHFICKTDYDSFILFKELGIFSQLKWQETKMGYFYEGELYKWGEPFALLKFPHLSLVEKVRYGLMALWCTKRKSWKSIESLPAKEWLTRWLGKRGYDRLWARLLYLKFYEHTPYISASWIGTRIKRIGLSRKSLLKEQLGYLEGGTETLVNALVAAIKSKGGEVLCSESVEQIEVEGGSVVGVRTQTATYLAGNVICTVPTPYVSKLVPALSKKVKKAYDDIPNIGVICLIFKLKKSVTENFWLNIIDENHAILGLIEFSRLRPIDEGHIVYAPYYMPTTNERWGWEDADLIEEAFSVIQAVNPEISKSDILSTKCSRLQYAQPICVPDFLKKLPSVQTEFSGLQIADTCYYYPEDRGISESVAFGRNMARTISAQ